MHERQPRPGIVLLGLVDTGDDRRPAVADHQLRVRRTGGERRAGRPFDRETDRGLELLHRDVHDDRARLGDLRGDRQAERGVDVRDGGGEVDARLQRDLKAALDLRGDVVLRHHARRGDDLDQTFRLRRVQRQVERERPQDVRHVRGDDAVARTKAECPRAERRIELAAETPHETVLLQEGLRRLDDARLDQHLARGHVDRVDEVLHRLQIGRDLTDDELVRTGIDDQLRLRRSDFSQQPGHVGRARIRKLAADRRQRNVELLLLRQLRAGPLFLRQARDRTDAHDVAFQDVRQVVLPEDDVEGLIPRNAREVDRDRAAHPWIRGDVETGEVRERPDDVLDVGVLQIQVDRFAGVDPIPRAELPPLRGDGPRRRQMSRRSFGGIAHPEGRRRLLRVRIAEDILIRSGRRGSRRLLTRLLRAARGRSGLSGRRADDDLRGRHLPGRHLLRDDGRHLLGGITALCRCRSGSRCRRDLPRDLRDFHRLRALHRSGRGSGSRFHDDRGRLARRALDRRGNRGRRSQGCVEGDPQTIAVDGDVIVLLLAEVEHDACDVGRELRNTDAGDDRVAGADGVPGQFVVYAREVEHDAARAFELEGVVGDLAVAGERYLHRTVVVRGGDRLEGFGLRQRRSADGRRGGRFDRQRLTPNRFGRDDRLGNGLDRLGLGDRRRRGRGLRGCRDDGNDGRQRLGRLFRNGQGRYVDRHEVVACDGLRGGGMGEAHAHARQARAHLRHFFDVDCADLGGKGRGNGEGWRLGRRGQIDDETRRGRAVGGVDGGTAGAQKEVDGRSRLHFDRVEQDARFGCGGGMRHLLGRFVPEPPCGGAVDTQHGHACQHQDPLRSVHASHLHHLTNPPRHLAPNPSSPTCGFPDPVLLDDAGTNAHFLVASGTSSLTTSRNRSIRVGSLTSWRNTTEEGVMRITSPSRHFSPTFNM